MAKIEPFERYTERYEAWFEKHRFAYQSEVEAIRTLLRRGKTLEIGCGTGRFSIPLGVKIGIEPSKRMADIARKRGMDIIIGVAEDLPIRASSFDTVMMVTTLCFLDSIRKALMESYRVLKPAGNIIIGFVDKNTPLGRVYQREKTLNPFYKIATFYSTEEVISHLKGTGFIDFSFCQTIFRHPSEMNNPDPVEEGYGRGSFVVIRARRSK